MKKKLLLLISVLAVLFSLAGCGKSEEVYIDRDQLINQTKTIVETYKDSTEKAAAYYEAKGTNLEATASKGFIMAQTTDHVGGFVGYDTSDENVSVSVNSDNTILVSIVARYEKRNVRVTVKYEQNLEYEMTVDEYVGILTTEASSAGMTPEAYIAYIESQSPTGYDTSSTEAWIRAFVQNQVGVTPYEATECEVSAIYSKAELLKMAGSNTIIGILTVFCVLVFISFIISLLKYVPALVGGKKQPEKAPVKAPVTEIKKPATVELAKEPEENLMDDAELVAVITAAIYAAQASEAKTSNAVSKDTLVVRSIKRVR